MKKIAIIYLSVSGNTQKMAEFIAEGIAQEDDVEATLKRVGDFRVDDLIKFDGFIIGSPVYYGSMAAEVKELFDRSVKFHTRLDGKVGAAFASSANTGGGNETTIADILNAMLIHGMVIQGNPEGDHYGPVSVGRPDERVKKQCYDLGKRTARLVKKVA
jgi:NAD(P)H dehydrogenase (quinone)